MNDLNQCGRVSRRTFLADTGMGMTGMALGAMLFRDGRARAAPSPLEARAKSVIWIFLIGGASHLESFDVKPALNQYAGKSFEETPFREAINPALINKNLTTVAKQKRDVYKKVFPLQVGYRRHGQAGHVVSDWFPHLATCIDDLALVRGMWTLDNNHGAQLTFHTGRKVSEGAFPTVGAWAAYGLGALSKNLPEFVVLGEPSADCCGAAWTHGAAYLGPQYAGVRMKVDAKNPLLFARPHARDFSPAEQAENFSLIGRLNRLTGIVYPDDKNLQARIKSYELAFQMQTAAPEVMAIDREPAHIRKLYGLEDKTARSFGQQCLAARRLVERGVRFVQLFHGGTGSAGAWDSHTNLKTNHAHLAKETDQPIAGLLKDLKQRGMLDDTLVVWGTEFGRTPGVDLLGRKKGTGRDHHPHGFTCWLAGGGVRGGIAHGATDELGFHAVRERHYVTDLHATVLHQLGLDSRQLEVPGRKRLDSDHGTVINKILT